MQSQLEQLEKDSGIEWQKYAIGDLFEVTRGLSMYVKDKKSFVYVNKKDINAIPLVQQMNHSNGISAFIDKGNLPEKFKNKVEKSGLITINPDQPLSYYQETEFIGNSVIIIDTSKLTKNQALYMVAEIQRIRKGSTWNDKFPKEKVKIAKIQLPTITENGKSQIAFDFIEKFIATLNAYLLTTGLKNYALTAEEQAALNGLNTVVWGTFNITSLFSVKNTRCILSRDIIENSGDVPYLTAGQSNNSVGTYIKFDNKKIDQGNCIFIGGKTFVVTYQENDFFSNDSHNLALYYKDSDKRTKNNQLFMGASIYKSLSPLYSWGDSISNKKIQKDTIQLPINPDNTPNYDYMHLLICAMQKVVIKNVVDYLDARIDATGLITSKP